MKGSIPRQFIDDLLTKSNIVDVINARVKLKKAGRDYQACCPLHTLRADIDYCQCEALTKVGLLGIKVWICRGEVYGKRDLAPNFTQEKESRGNNYNGGRKFRNKRNNNR